VTEPLDNARVDEMSRRLEEILAEAGKVVVGQRPMLEGLLVGLMTGGHVLLEGVPGLAKTLAVRTLAGVIDAGFQRIQFTPDLLPKVQSALLEAMQERQVTIGEQTFKLADPFLVLATQNPIEQEGTYPLPEAQVDRFLLKLKVGYPTRDEERLILDRMAGREPPTVRPVIAAGEVRALRRGVSGIHLDEKIKGYILDLVFATRDPAARGLDVAPLIAYGASPRATLALAQAARARALLAGRAFVVPEDVKAVGHAVLRHRVLVTYEAEAERKTSDDIITYLFDHVEVP